MNIYTQNLPVCNSGQHTYVTGLFNFFFVLQDLIDRIDSYFQRIAFQKNLLLIGVSILHWMEWSYVNWKGKIMAEKVVGEYQTSKFPFF